MRWVVAGVILAVCVYAVVLYNRLVRLRNMASEGWSGIDVQLRRRTDIIPNLVDTVKGYAAHERSLFEEITKQRASSIAADNVPGQAQAERALKGSLDRLIAVAENYPQLKANENFLKLQQQLSDIEDQLQMARRYYNGTVRNLNIAIESFPNTLVSRPFGFKEAAFFEPDDRADAAVPTVGISAP